MSDKEMALATSDGAWEIVVDTRPVVRCADHETAARLCSLIEGDDTDLPARPRALSNVMCFETAEGAVEVVVGTKAIACCADWRWATRVARLVEVDEYKHLAPAQMTDLVSEPRLVARGGGPVR